MMVKVSRTKTSATPKARIRKQDDGNWSRIVWDNIGGSSHPVDIRRETGFGSRRSAQLWKVGETASDTNRRLGVLRHVVVQCK